MRRLMMAAAAAASLLASSAFATNVTGTPAPAVAPPTTVAGYVGIQGGALLLWIGGGPPPDFIFPAATIDAAVVWSRPSMDVQLELRGYGIFQPALFGIAGAVVHAYGRTPGVAFGGFVGYETAYSATVHILHVGVEAVLFRDRASLFGQLGTVHNLALSGGAGFAWYARGAARFFPRENVRLELGMRYWWFTPSTAGLTVETEGEFQLPGRPLSFLVNLRASNDGAQVGYAAQAGFRLNFGGGDLIDQRAPMDTLPYRF